MTRQRLVSAVREALERAGVEADMYAGHSFRIGAATTAASRGLEDSTIQTLGRWRSLAYLEYIRIPRRQLASFLLDCADGLLFEQPGLIHVIQLCQSDLYCYVAPMLCCYDLSCFQCDCVSGCMSVHKLWVWPSFLQLCWGWVVAAFGAMVVPSLGGIKGVYPHPVNLPQFGNC